MKVPKYSSTTSATQVSDQNEALIVTTISPNIIMIAPREEELDGVEAMTRALKNFGMSALEVGGTVGSFADSLRNVLKQL